MGGGYRKSLYDVFVLFPFQRTGGVDQPPSGLQIPERPLEDLTLQLGETRQIGQTQPPLDLGIPRQRSCAGARGVHQDPIELRIKWECRGGIQNHALGLRRDVRQTFQISIAGDSTIKRLSGIAAARAFFVGRSPSEV